MRERMRGNRPKRLVTCMTGVAFVSLFLVADVYCADEWEQSVREANESSVVFIDVKATRPNGLVDAFTGTGFIVHPDGYVLTCNHVVPKQEPNYQAVEPTGSVGSRYEYPSPMEVIRRDDQLDLVLLKLPQRALRWRSVESSAQGKNGSRIVVLGFPLNENLLGVPGSITGTDGKGGRWLTNAPINRGMSGGPVFDRNGAVIAIASGGYEEAQGLNLIIPISFAKSLLDAVNSPLLSAVASGQHGGDSDLKKKRDLALLLGYDGAFALAHALIGRPIAQDRARLAEYLRQLNMGNITFPENPLGEQKDAVPASTFAQEVAGTLEARDFRLQRAFLVGWLGVIATNTPSLKPPEFELEKFAKEAGFPDQGGKSDIEYLEDLVKQAAPVASRGLQALLTQNPPEPRPTAASPREQIANDYRFVLRHCRPDGADLLCTIGVTNLRQTRKLTLKPRSRLISVDGVSYEVDKFVKDTGVAYNSGMTLDTLTDVELTFGLRFFGIAHKFTKAQLLQLSCPGFEVQWRNFSFP